MVFGLYSFVQNAADLWNSRSWELEGRESVFIIWGGSAQPGLSQLWQRRSELVKLWEKVKHQPNNNLHPSVIQVIVIDYNTLFRFKIPEIKKENVCHKRGFNGYIFLMNVISSLDFLTSFHEATGMSKNNINKNNALMN